MTKKKKSVIKQAYDIVELRSEEKSRQYGSFSDGMSKMAKIASILCGKQLSTQDMFYCMVALKLSRQSFNFKEDNLVDAIAYLGGLSNYVNEQNKKLKTNKK